MRAPLPAVTVLAVALGYACAMGDVPTGAPGDATPILAPSFQLIPSPADGSAGPIDRVRTVTERLPDTVVVDESVFAVSPTAPSWELTISVPTTVEMTVLVTVYLIHTELDGSETVEFSGRTGPIMIGPSRPATPAVPIVRGSLANLFVTGVTITDVPQSLVQGQSAALAAVASSSGGGPPELFWTSLDPGVLSVDDSFVTGVSVGTGRVAASAGAHADTVQITVTSSDQQGPWIVEASPAPGATGVVPSTSVQVTFDEPLDAATVTTSTFSLTDSTGAPVAGTVTYQGVEAIYTPDAELDSLHLYTVRLTQGITDLAGNPFLDVLSWTFETGGPIRIVDSFQPGLGLLVAVAYDPLTGNLFVHDDFSDTIPEFTAQGVAVPPAIPRPGPSSNDFDLDFLESATTVGSTQVPANTLLVVNGETVPTWVYAVDKDQGAVLDSVPSPTGSNAVGGAFHPRRGTLFVLDWSTSQITEMDLATGQALASFPVSPQGSPPYSMFYGDVEVDPATGNLLIGSSSETSIRVLSETGMYLRDLDIGSIGVGAVSGLAWDAQTRTLWVVDLSGMVYRLSGVG